MKKFLKILGVLLGIIFAAFIALVILGCIVGSDEESDSEIYTYTPDVIAEYKPLFPPWGQVDESTITDAMYYDTIEEAIEHDEALAESDEESKKDAHMLNHISEILHTWEGEEYVTVYYRSENADQSKQGFVLAKCRKKDFDGKTKYAYSTAQYTIARRNGKMLINFEEDIGSNLRLSDAMQELNPTYPNTRFACGYAYDENIYTLEVEGQKPDGILAFDVYGRTTYFWYYENLKSDKAGGSLRYTVHRGH